MRVSALPARMRGLSSEYQVLVSICVLIFVNQLGFGSIVPVVPLYARSFGVSQAAIGLTLAVFGLARFLVSLPTAQVADRWGRRHALALGALLTTLGNVLCALAPSYTTFLLARFVAGLGTGMILTACVIILTDISTPERRGRMMGVYNGVFAFGVGIGPLPGGLLAEQFGLSAPFWAFSVMGAVASLLAWFRVPETRMMRGALPQPSGSGAAPAPRLSFGQQVRLFASQPSFLLISLVSFSAFFSRTGGLFNVIPVLADERLHLTPDQIGLGLSSISVMALLLAYPSGIISDRFGRKVVIVPATLGTGLAFIVFPMAPTFFWFMVACAVWSFGTGFGSAAPNAYAADLVPPGMNAAAMGSYRMLAESGYVAGPLIIGATADVFGVDVALGMTAALLIVVGLAFWLFAPEVTHRRAAA